MTASNCAGSCSQDWRVAIVEEEKTNAEIAGAIGGREVEDEEIVPDQSVVSGDITDPEFLRLMVSYS